MDSRTWAIIAVLFCALLGATAQILWKMASSGLTINVFSWVLNWKVILGMFLYGMSALIFIYALKFGNVSVLYPIIATGYIWAALMATKFLGESMPTVKWFGLATIILGVFLITR